MDVPVYQEVQQIDKHISAANSAITSMKNTLSTINSNISDIYSPFDYAEHQFTKTDFSFSSLTSIVSVSGKGILEEAAIVYENVYLALEGELKILIDGSTVFDTILSSYSGNNIRSSCAALVKTMDVCYGYACYYLTNFADRFGFFEISGSPTTIKSFPSSTQSNVSTSNNGFCIVQIPSGIPFSSSLDIKVKGGRKGTEDAGTVGLTAKVRY
jgi:hypothetical protein